VAHINELKDIGGTLFMINMKYAKELVVERSVWRTEEPLVVQLGSRVDVSPRDR